MRSVFFCEGDQQFCDSDQESERSDTGGRIVSEGDPLRHLSFSHRL